MGKGKITVTIDKELVAELDRFAKSRGESRSSVLETAIRSWKCTRLRRELMEGYRAMADEDLKVAEENLSAGYEVLK
jgi:metal-responsive CopG/Arc/MetJ family transcriptional regulator